MHQLDMFLRVIWHRFHINLRIETLTKYNFNHMSMMNTQATQTV